MTLGAGENIGLQIRRNYICGCLTTIQNKPAHALNESTLPRSTTFEASTDYDSLVRSQPRKRLVLSKSLSVLTIPKGLIVRLHSRMDHMVMRSDTKQYNTNARPKWPRFCFIMEHVWQKAKRKGAPRGVRGRSIE